MCTSDDDCRLDYGAFIGGGLTIICSTELGVCTFV
jgi:hypothetical protein